MEVTELSREITLIRRKSRHLRVGDRLAEFQQEFVVRPLAPVLRMESI